MLNLKTKTKKSKLLAPNSDGHDQIMIEFCSTMICSIGLDHRGRQSDHDRADHP